MSPSPSTAATASATLSDEARARIPDTAREHSPQGAEAFARFYLEQVNKAWTTPDPELIRPYALESCKTCANYVATARWLGDKGLSYDGVPSTLGASGVLPAATQDAVAVQVVQVQRAVKLLHADGTVERQLPRSGSLLDVQLRWRIDTWHIASIKGAHA